MQEETTEGGGVVFWNMEGLRGKDREFLRNLGKWDVVVNGDLYGGEGMKKIERLAAEGFKWGVQHARRRNRKERTIGGMLMGIKKELIERGKEIEVGKEGLIVSLRWEKQKWRVVGVYGGRGGIVAKN